MVKIYYIGYLILEKRNDNETSETDILMSSNNDKNNNCLSGRHIPS